MKRPGIVALAVSLTLAVHRWLSVRREWRRLKRRQGRITPDGARKVGLL